MMPSDPSAVTDSSRGIVASVHSDDNEPQTEGSTGAQGSHMHKFILFPLDNCASYHKADLNFLKVYA